MGLFARLEQRGIETWPPSAGDDFWYHPVGAQAGSTEVTPDNSLTLPAVYRAVALLAGTQATLPLQTHRGDPEGDSDPIPSHPVYNLLRLKPNPWQTAVEFFEMGQTHVLLRGNAFSRVARDRVGRVEALIPWHPDRVKISIVGERIVYTLKRHGNKPDVSVPQEDMLHVRGPGGNGIVGWSPITIAAEAIGAGFAAQAYGKRFFDNSARPSGTLTHPAKLNKISRDNITESWNAAHGGGKQGGTALLEEGLVYTPISLTPEEAQFLETQKFNVLNIARIFGVPPHMLMEMSAATFGNIEHQAIEFAKYSLRTWLVRWEQAIKITLFPGEDDVFAQFQMDAILRGDSLARAQSNEIQWRSGVINIDEWRARENLNALPDGKGKTHLIPINFQPLDQAIEGLPDIEADVPPDDDEDRAAGGFLLGPGQVDVLAHIQGVEYLRRSGVDNETADALSSLQIRSVASRHRQLSAFKRLFESVGARIVGREVTAVRRALRATNGGDGLASRLATFYASFGAVVAKELHPALRTYAEIIYGIASGEVGGEGFDDAAKRFVRDYADNAGTRYAFSSQGQLETLIEEAEDPEAVVVAVGKRADEWEEKRAAKIASRETRQMSGAITQLAYAAAAITLLRWVTVGQNCPLCDSLNGKIVGIEENFVEAGGTVQGSGVAPFKAKRAVGHTPLHGGCDCQIVAET